MSRSGYSDNFGEDYPGQMELYRATVDRAIGGKRGQAFLRELVEALDAMPVKELVEDALEYADGAVCAIGAVCKKRGLDTSGVDPFEPEEVGKLVGISRCMAAEIEYENDRRFRETPAERWQRMRDWAARNLKPSGPQATCATDDGQKAKGDQPC